MHIEELRALILLLASFCGFFAGFLLLKQANKSNGYRRAVFVLLSGFSNGLAFDLFLIFAEIIVRVFIEHQ